MQRLALLVVAVLPTLCATIASAASYEVTAQNSKLRDEDPFSSIGIWYHQFLYNGFRDDYLARVPARPESIKRPLAGNEHKASDYGDSMPPQLGDLIKMVQSGYEPHVRF